ncbi:hypothetical protein NIES4071_21030 [Calothrix sp. NIES-4071]|nr:hypothetical protein NIES4071_21030 [Calothrix sp. NIES-4071]BAZ56435.1 hypothetical protein NIES4105_20980 [Calothrix sp. NIES-4105]
MKKTWMSVRFTCLAVFMLFAQFITPPNLQAAPPPKPPSTGTPKGNSSPGTTRPEVTCKQTSKPLTALNANNGNDYTVSENPSFWFYVPYTQDDVKRVEFLLLDGQETTTIYRTEIKLAAKPGLIKVSLPANSQNSLKPNQNYRWYLMLSCRASRSDEPDVVVDGWIQRKIFDSNPQVNKSQKFIFYTKNNIWYDAINDLAQQRFQNPNNTDIQNAWKNLLKLLGKDWVAQEQFVDAAIMPIRE